ncbi:MAG: hypothetical protein ICV63_11650 [Coleofasciculus sp. Co-bin14]|nr:hypothetical protein [Coleofasciculus sp. Co-bin14]
MRLRIAIALGISGTIAINSEYALAQSKIVPDSTLGAEGSIVIPSSGSLPTEIIQGGSIRGTNLFHSFQEASGRLSRLLCLNTTSYELSDWGAQPFANC